MQKNENGMLTAEVKRESEMADFSISCALENLFSFLSKQVNFITGIHKELEDVQNELQSIQAFLKEAESRPATEAGIQTLTKELRDVAFQIDVLIDEYKAHMARCHGPAFSKAGTCGAC